MKYEVEALVDFQLNVIGGNPIPLKKGEKHIFDGVQMYAPYSQAVTAALAEKWCVLREVEDPKADEGKVKFEVPKTASSPEEAAKEEKAAEEKKPASKDKAKK